MDHYRSWCYARILRIGPFPQSEDPGHVLVLDPYLHASKRSIDSADSL